MKLHFFEAWHESHGTDSHFYDNLKYGTLLVIGVPAVVIGARYIIETFFSMIR